MPCGCCCAPVALARRIHTTPSLKSLLTDLERDLKKNIGSGSYHDYTIVVRGKSKARVEEETPEILLPKVHVSKLFFERLTLTDNLLKAFREVEWDTSHIITIGDRVNVKCSLRILFSLSTYNFNLKSLENSREFYRELRKSDYSKSIWAVNLKNSLHLLAPVSNLTQFLLKEDIAAMGTTASIQLIFRAIGKSSKLRRFTYETQSARGTIFETLFVVDPMKQNNPVSRVTFDTTDEILEALKLSNEIKPGIYIELRFFQDISNVPLFLRLLKNFRGIHCQLSFLQTYQSPDAFLRARLAEISNLNN